ncbi:MAG TPA: DNA repair protein RecO [Polyangiaceae bacterium]|nr:DNA repair protein RecO [Polyangiaceae bacterium]
MVSTDALLLRKVAFRDSDAMLTLFTPEHGKISALARGAARSQRRFGGALEPIHTLRVDLVTRRHEHFELGACQLLRTRLGLTQSLERVEAAGKALGWIRQAAMDRSPEPLVWQLILQLLDRLDAAEAIDCQHALAALGLGLLTAWGWGLELDQCVRCGRVCPEQRAAYVDVAAGGVICSQCGGARTLLDGALRTRLAQTARGETSALLTGDAGEALRLFEATLAAHADLRC